MRKRHEPDDGFVSTEKIIVAIRNMDYQEFDRTMARMSDEEVYVFVDSLRTFWVGVEMTRKAQVSDEVSNRVTAGNSPF